MEDIHNILASVLRKHYGSRSEIILRAKDIINDYINTGTPNYEQTLSMLYLLMKDLPADILLYFLTTVPLPTQTEYSSHLCMLMKHMLTLSYQKTVRPIMLAYLYANPPPLVPISNENKKEVNNNPGNTQNIEVTPLSSADNEESLSATLVEHVRSVIDENIQQNKLGKKRPNRSTRNASKNAKKKCFRVKPLTHMCSEHIFKSHLYYRSFYTKKKHDALKLLNDKNIDKQSELQCHKILRDVDKKLEWLKMFSTGKVPLKLIEEEYKDSEVLHPPIPDDTLQVTPEIKHSVDLYINKC